VSVRLIHVLSVREGKKKEQKSKREKKETDHNCFIIEVLLYSTYNNNNTCIFYVPHQHCRHRERLRET
jgi:hypothetical protein